MKDLKQLIKSYQEKNDWLGVYNEVKPISELHLNDQIWNDADLLSTISFATAKLSETSINLKHTFKDEVEKNKFLTQQKAYRTDTESLRKRCIELKPQNATFYSNLGYTYYQYVWELTQIGGRRDGRALDEVENALTYINKALSINPNRITDLYRKGMLLAEQTPKLILFTKANLTNRDKAKSAATTATGKIKEGINAFSTAIAYWESLSDENDFNGNLRKKHIKDYIKCLYNLAKAYFDLIQNNWDAEQYALSFNYGITGEDRITYIPEDLKHITKAIELLQKCCVADNPNVPLSQSSDYLEIGAHTGNEEGIHKLYSLGKYYFTKYWVISGYGQRSNQEADFSRDYAEKFYMKALEFNWSAEKVKQDKVFIAEKLARLYITKQEYSKATNILEQYIFKKRKVDYYVYYTLSLAYINLKQFDKARQVLDSALQDEFGNKEIWLGKFLKACSDIREGKFDSARKELAEAANWAAKVGKTNLDSLLIAQGFIEYKKNNKSEAVKFLHEANSINPYRVAIQRFENKWKK